MAALYPSQFVSLPCDVGDDAKMQDLFASLPLELRPDYLDGLIMAAGICEYVDLPELDLASIRRVLEVNYFGVVNACKLALPLLEAAARRPGAGKAELVGICSLSVLTGFPRAEAYGSAKAAMRYFLEALRCDVQKYIDVTVVYPGFVTTPMTAANDFPMPFCLDAEPAAACILRQLGRGKRSIAFPWQLHWLLRVASWLPGLWYGLAVKQLSRRGRAST